MNCQSPQISTALTSMIALLAAACGGGGGSGGGSAQPTVDDPAPQALLLPPGEDLNGTWFVRLGGAECDASGKIDIVGLELQGVASISVVGQLMTLEFSDAALAGVSFEGTYDASSGEFQLSGNDVTGLSAQLQGRLRADASVAGFVFTDTNDLATVIIDADGVDPRDPLFDCYGIPLDLEVYAARIDTLPIPVDISGEWEIQHYVVHAFGSTDSMTPAIRRVTLSQNDIFLSGFSSEPGTPAISGLVDDDTNAQGTFGALLSSTRGWTMQFCVSEGRLVGLGVDFVYAHAGDKDPSAVSQFLFEGIRTR